MVGNSNFRYLIYTLVILIPVVLQFQNCTGKNQVSFLGERQSITSSATGGGGYDGKPGDGYYCRVFDDIQCQTQVDDLQGLVKVDTSGIHLNQDNCATTSFNFLAADAAINYTPLMSDYVGVSRGIFKKCEVGANNLPLPPTEMTDAYCVSEDGNTALTVNKNIQSKEFDFKLVFRDGNEVRSATGDSITKSLNSNSSSYVSQMQAFTLTISNGNSQTNFGQLETVVDQKSLTKTLNCRQANAAPTVIIKDDMELSSTWIDTSQLVGYWKLNEPTAIEGTPMIDSSPFASSGRLLTGNDGLNKNEPTVKGGAISLDGVDDYIEISRPLDNHLDFDTRSFSYMVWIKKTTAATNWELPFAHGGSNLNLPGYEFECGPSGNCRACISDGGNLASSMVCSALTGGGTFYSGNWVLLIAVVDRSTQQLRTYVDGTLVSSTNISSVGSVTNGTNTIAIGRGNSPTFLFMGSIDDAAIWNRALSGNEVVEIFQRTRPKFY